MSEPTDAELRTEYRSPPYPDEYIGDGVYASFDGYHIWLKTQEGHRVALEPSVMVRLRNYERAVYQHFNRAVPK